MKKFISNICCIFFSFFIVFDVANAGCNSYHTEGKSGCESHSVGGYKCKWDGNKKGGSRCFQGNELAEETKTEITSCSQLKNSSSCNGTVIGGTNCIWRQNACYSGTTSETNYETVIDGTDLSPETTPNKYSRCSDLSFNETVCKKSVFNYQQCTWQNNACISGEEMVDVKKKINGVVIDQGVNNNPTNNGSNNGSGLSANPSENYEMCSNPNTLKTLSIFGELIKIAKVLVPLIIIITGVSGLVKSVISDDDKEIKTSVSLLIKKFCVGVFVFFIPTITFAIIGYVDSYNGSTFQACKDCLANGSTCASESLATCEDNSLLGNPTTQGTSAYYLQIAFNYMKYAGLIICIVLTIVDIIKGLTSDNKGLSQDIAKTFFKRLIYAAMLFFTPSIVNVILTIVGVYGTCGIS